MGRVFASALVLAVAVAHVAFAEQPTVKDLLAPQADAGSSTPGGPSQATVSGNAFDRGTPRAAVTGFLSAAESDDWLRAARYLDVSKLSRTDGADVARLLKTVLDRELWIEPSALSADPAGYAADDLPRDRDLVGWIDTPDGPLQILVAKGVESGAPVWRFAPETVARVPALFNILGYSRVDAVVPHALLEYHFLDMQLWQWIGVLALAVGAFSAAWALAALIGWLLSPLARRNPTHIGRGLAAGKGPLRLIAGVSVFAAGTFWLDLPVPVRTILAALEQLLVIAAVTWVILRSVDVLCETVRNRLERRGQIGAAMLVPPGRRTLKATILLVALIAVLDGLGFKVTALIAGLGVGGLAVALAAQKSIENLFGGITLYLDQPVRVGDFCRFGSAIGTVEDIGLRSTRIRTLDRTLISVPNGDFATLQLENFSTREQMWFHPTVSLPRQLHTAQVRAVLATLRQRLAGHALVDSQSVRVHLVRFSDAAYEVEISLYIEGGDQRRYLDVAEELNLDIMQILEDASAEQAAAANGRGTSGAVPEYRQDVSTSPDGENGRRQPDESGPA